MITRRDFLSNAAVALATAAAGPHLLAQAARPQRSRVVSVSAPNVLSGDSYNPDVVSRMFDAGMRALTGEKTAADAWASLVTPHDVVGIKVNCIAAPRLSTSLASIQATIAALKHVGVRDNNIIVWDHADGAFARTGLTVNRSTSGVRIHGTAKQAATVLPWVQGFDKKVYIELEAGTTTRYRELMNQNFTATGTHREIFNSLTWLWTLVAQGNPKAQKYAADIRRLYTDYNDREGIKRIAEEVATQFNDVQIEDERRSYFSRIVTEDVTKLVNLAVLKHNEDSGVTLATKNIALGVTTNKVRFHLDFCTRAISEIVSAPCIKDKLVLNVGEAAKISSDGSAGNRLAYDTRIFFSKDPVALDAIGLDLLEQKRKEQGLPSIASEATHVAACARRGVGIVDRRRIDLRAIRFA